MVEEKLPAEVLTFLTHSDAPEWKSGLILTDDFSPWEILQGRG